MHKFTRLGSLVLASVCLLSMAGCGKKKEESKSSKDDKSATVTETTKDTEEESESAEKSEGKTTTDPEMEKDYSKTYCIKLFELYMNYHKQANEDQHGTVLCFQPRGQNKCIPVLVWYDEELIHVYGYFFTRKNSE